MSKEDVLLFGCYGMRGSGKSYYEQLNQKDKEIARLKKDIEVFKFTIRTQQEQIQELIAREDKAIEYIEENEWYTKLRKTFINNLLNILKGDRKDGKN